MLEGQVRPYRVAIIGGGASGVCLAGLLAEQSRPDRPLEVEIFDQGEALLRKVLATGNGRCNFTNLDISLDHYTGESREFPGPILESFGFEEATAFFRRLGLPSRVLDSGMTYPATMKADSLVRILEAWVHHQGVRVRLSCEIRAVEKKDGAYRVQDGEGKVRGPYQALVLATGGAYGIGKKEWSRGYSLVKDLGHRLTPIHPAICGLVVRESDFCGEATGDKLEAGFRMVNGEGRIKTRSGDLLFTDYGISGMGVFRLSNDLLGMVGDGVAPEVTVDLLPDLSLEEGADILGSLYESRKDWKAEEALAGLFPVKVLQATLEEGGIQPDQALSQAPLSQYEAWLASSKTMIFHVEGARKKDHGQVTCGGLATGQVDPRSLESVLTPDLYFMGEVLDVQGECGGYNLHWAWASAHAVSRAIQNRIAKET